MHTDLSGPKAAFTKQSVVFDELDRSNPLSAHLRSAFRSQVDRFISPGSRILELNCGTGLDAFYFASKGHRVLATDAAEGMMARVREKQQGAPGAGVDSLLLSYHDLWVLDGRKFDHIVSSFGGLNCTPDLHLVLERLPGLLTDNGKVTLVIMPKVCPWELLMVLKGKFRTAFRRFRSRTPAKVEGIPFYCYYYNPSYVIRHLKPHMRVLSLRGVSITVPPEFYAGFVERYPKLYRLLSAADRFIGAVFPFNRLCDHYIITLQKK